MYMSTCTPVLLFILTRLVTKELGPGTIQILYEIKQGGMQLQSMNSLRLIGILSMLTWISGMLRMVWADNIMDGMVKTSIFTAELTVKRLRGEDMEKMLLHA